MKTSTEKIIFKAFTKEGLLEDLQKVFDKFKGHEITLVGGALRDVLNTDQEKVFDLDFATPLKPEEILKVLEHEKVLKTGIKFGTVTWVLGQKNFEITTYRVFEEYANHRQPNSLSFGDSLDEDLKRRDFTVNAMTLLKSTTDSISFYDPLKGLNDLKDKKLKAIGDPLERFNEDAIRILRLYRLYLIKNFSIEDQTFKASIESFKLLQHVSHQRIITEVEKTFNKPVYLQKIKRLWKSFTDLEIDSSIFDFCVKKYDSKGAVKIKVDEVLWIYLFFLAEEKGLIKNFLVKNKHKKMFSFYKNIKKSNTPDLALKDFIVFSENYEGVNSKWLWVLVKSLKPKLLDGFVFNEDYHRYDSYINELKEKKTKYKRKELGEEILKTKVFYAFNK